MSQDLRTQAGGEMTARFVTFVTMHAQQVGLFLGEVPHPERGRVEVNLEAARLLIDQLDMIREKTAGNLTKEESELLNGVLSDLQLAYVRVATSAEAQAQQGGGTCGQEVKSEESGGEGDESSKKRFVKHYGS